MKSWAQYPVSIGLGLIFLLGGIYLGHLVLFSDAPLVGIIQWTKEIKTFDESLQGVIEGLREEGYQERLNIRVKVINAGGNRDKTAAAVRELMQMGARLLITVGTVPTLMALEMTRHNKIPIVYTNVGAPDTTGPTPPAPPAPARFTGTSMEVPIYEQLRFLLLARPGLKRLGILCCSATPQGLATGQETAEVAPRLGLAPILRTVKDDHPALLDQALVDLLNERIEALFIPTDPVLRKPKNLKIICEVTMRAFIPVIVPDGNSVVYGPLMSYHCDFVEMGRQSGRQAALLLNGVPLEQVPPEVPNTKKLTVNLKVARELDFLLDRRLLSQAQQFYQ